MKKFFCLIIGLLVLVGCSSSVDKFVTYMEAKEKIINENAILLDVRTEEEYSEDHIDGAILLPLDSINKENIEKIINDKEQVIIVYCRSGNRSSQALSLIEELGYNEVYDLGAMSNWEE